MSKARGKGVRTPATKLPHLQKKLRKTSQSAPRQTKGRRKG